MWRAAGGASPRSLEVPANRWAWPRLSARPGPIPGPVLKAADAPIRWAVERSEASRSRVSVDVAGRRWSFTPLTGGAGEPVGLAAVVRTAPVPVPVQF